MLDRWKKKKIDIFDLLPSLLCLAEHTLHTALYLVRFQSHGARRNVAVLFTM
jgi:hypothetical protein